MATVVVATIGASGADHTTWESWEQATDTDCVTADEVRWGDFIDASYTQSANMVILGATTDATRFRGNRASAAQQYDPVADTGFEMTVTAASTSQIQLAESYYKLGDVGRGFRMTQGNDDASERRVVRNQDTTIIVESMFLDVSSSSSSQRYGIQSGSAVTARNCIAIGDGTGAETAYQDTNKGGTWHNCVAHKLATRGFRQINTAGCDVTNCSSTECGTADFDTHTSTGTFATNASSDTTGTSGLTSLTYTDEFNDPDNNDFRLQSGSALEDAGTDLSGTFTTDFDGDTRGATWEVGAYDGVVAAGGGFVPYPNPRYSMAGGHQGMGGGISC